MKVASAYEQLQAKEEQDSSRIPDFVLGCALPVSYALPGIGYSATLTALFGVVGLAALRRPDPRDRMPFWAPLLGFLMVGWLGLSMVYNGNENYVQGGYFALWVVAILAFASGRVDRVSICRGVGVGLTLGALAGLASRFAGIGSNTYPGRLTGEIWGDPNQAAYYLTVLTCVTLVGLRPGWRRYAAVTLFAACVILTLSRTGITAMLVAALWFAIRRRTAPGLGLILSGATTYGLLQLSERFRNWGPFSDRAGSDILRERIDAASRLAVSEHPIIGRGPGTGQVQVGDRTFYFHNAYLAVRNNGGWVLLILILVLIGLVMLSLLRLPEGAHHPWHEASLIALLIVALSLGEAFLRAPSALAIGLALRHTINPFELRRSDRDDSPDRVF